MNFGVRLPGPFRVGISSSGRLSAGVTMGPFSVSTSGGPGRADAAEIRATLQEAIAYAEQEGWKVRGTADGVALATQGLRTVQLLQTSPRTVVVRRVTSRWKVALWGGLAIAAVVWFSVAVS